VSAPELPEVFGNYVLGDFVEVVSPAGVSWLPQTTGWYWLGAACLLLLLRYSWRRLQHWHRNRYRREATRRLEKIGAADDGGSFLVELNRLLKLAAIAGFGRERVASLDGEAWVEFLNSQCDTAPFTAQLGNCLAAGPYRGTAVDETTRRQLLSACEYWLLQHREPGHA